MIYAATGASGLFESVDSGASWTYLDVPEGTAVEVEPGSHRVYIPSHEVCGGVGNGLCVSHDGGEKESWEAPAVSWEVTTSSSLPPERLTCFTRSHPMA